jgi:hypothetical protein
VRQAVPLGRLIPYNRALDVLMNYPSCGEKSRQFHPRVSCRSRNSHEHLHNQSIVYPSTSRCGLALIKHFASHLRLSERLCRTAKRRDRTQHWDRFAPTTKIRYNQVIRCIRWLTYRHVKVVGDRILRTRPLPTSCQQALAICIGSIMHERSALSRVLGTRIYASLRSPEG